MIKSSSLLLLLSVDVDDNVCTMTLHLTHVPHGHQPLEIVQRVFASDLCPPCTYFGAYLHEPVKLLAS